MRTARLLALISLAFVSCRDTTVPDQLGPGTVRATVMTARPGRAEVEPAAGATVTLVGTTQTATADDDGNVRLSGISTRRGRLLFELDLDADGGVDQSRLINLETVEAGFGRDVNLGQVVLSRNATVVGRVRRGDRIELPTGHGGVSVFLPQLPQLSWSGDDGSFELRGVPEGNLVVSFFTSGYRPVALSLEIGAGQQVRLADVVLVADPGANPIGRLTGTVLNVADETPLAAVQILGASEGVEHGALTTAEGTFALETLPTGVYALSLSRTGLTPLRIDGVLVAPGVNDLGTLRMGSGEGVLRPLDGGPTTPDLDAGPHDSGMPDAGMPDAGTPDSGTPDSGTPDSGTPDAGDVDAGNIGPIAVAGPTQTVARSSLVRLNGTASTGDFPLRYRWTQRAGPAVTLSSNDLVTSHSPTFTAPATATQLEFALEVIDRNQLVSTNTSITRITVSDVPVARFTPDGGLYIGGQTVPFQSTSFDDGGLLIVSHEWRLGSNSYATLVTDGGPSALVSFLPLMPGDPDRLARVELQVTNAVGATSPTFARDYIVRAGTTTNWSVSILPLGGVNVGVNPPTVNLTATLNLPAGAPTPAVAWSCIPEQALLAPNSLTPSFVAPVVAGDSISTVCTVVATGSAPLLPLTQSASLTVVFLDVKTPTYVSTEEARWGPWGRSYRFSEPMVTATMTAASCSGGNAASGTLLTFGSWGVTQAPIAPATCGAVNISSGTDRAGQNLASTPLGGVTGSTIWEGPFVSTAQFADPRPVLPSISQVPSGTYELAGTGAPAPGIELLASAPGTVFRFAIDQRVADAGCTASCALPSTSFAAPWVTGGHVPIRRTYAARDSMFTLFQTDGDGGTALLERFPDGGFAGPVTLPGWVVSSRGGSETFLDSVSFDAGAIDRWRYDVPSRQWVRGERIATGITSVEDATGNERQVIALVGASRTLTVWTYGTSGGITTWHNYPTPAQLSAAPPMRDLHAGHVNWLTPNIFWTYYTRPNGSTGLYRLFDTINLYANPFVGDRSWGVGGFAGNGFDWVVRGDTAIGVRAEGGQIYLSTLDYGSMSGSTASTTFPGPTRAGSPPYPTSLNVDTTCEAAWPRLALVDDRLFVTWQERCAPETQWRVMLRVVR